MLGVPTTLVRETRRLVSRDETAQPCQSFSKTKPHVSSMCHHPPEFSTTVGHACSPDGVSRPPACLRVRTHVAWTGRNPIISSLRGAKQPPFDLAASCGSC